MNIRNLIIGSVLLLSGGTAFSMKDAVYNMPVLNYVLPSYQQLSAQTLILPNFVGRNELCQVSVWQPGEVGFFKVSSSNFVTESGDTPDGEYQVGSSIMTLYKYNIHAFNYDVPSNWRFTNLSTKGLSYITVNCFFF